MSGNSLKLEYSLIKNHFEKDTHGEVQYASVERIHVLCGATPKQDVIAVIYQGVPHMTFYDYAGRVIDVDHYLPDHFRQHDTRAVKSIKQNLANYEAKEGATKTGFKKLLKKVFQVGNGLLRKGLELYHGFQISDKAMATFQKHTGFVGTPEQFIKHLSGHYSDYDTFLDDLIAAKHASSNGYVHITLQDNIVITTLNKRSGVAVMIETQDAEGKLMHPDQWRITRTQSIETLEQSLIFKTPDIQALYDDSQARISFKTDRYELIYRGGSLAMDSLLDDTKNLFETSVHADCFQVLSTDRNVVIVLSDERTVSIVNTHLSIIPQKWVKKISLPYAVKWLRVDQNLSTAFAIKNDGVLVALNIDGSSSSELEEIGAYGEKFELDTQGNIICLSSKEEPVFIKTNVADLELPEDQKNLHSVIETLAHLFKGEKLFTKVSYAKPISEKQNEEEDVLPEVIAGAKYDFESNIEHMLVQAGRDYDKYLEIQNKIAIARSNIADHITTTAESHDIILAGQRLKNVIDLIISPAETKVRNICEQIRSRDILEKSRAYIAQLNKMSNPAEFRNILHDLRRYELELNTMADENIGEVYQSFKLIHKELNNSFADQISKDGTALQDFITKEIDEIEKAINNAHELKQLEVILSTHPAALELFSLLKQPYILQSMASESTLSPAGIQRRLFDVADARRNELKEEEEKLQAQKNAAKIQLADMIRTSIDQFVANHSAGFSSIVLSDNANYFRLMSDIRKVEVDFGDTRLAMELKRFLERRILERNRKDLDKLVTFEGQYAFIQNDPDLFVDMDSTIVDFASWDIDLVEKTGEDAYGVVFIKSSDKEVYRPSTIDNLNADNAFSLSAAEYPQFISKYADYVSEDNSYEFIAALWSIYKKEQPTAAFAQFAKTTISTNLPKGKSEMKALRCALEKKSRDHQERHRQRNVPVISPEFIDETPYFQYKLYEFSIKAKLQLVSGSGIILLSGPPSTGKSAFLKFISAIMNREYFEHASDKWQTKNSLVTAIKFGERGPYSVPAGFTKAITTPYSLVNIEEIKEWPEALRKSLNPFFAGSKVFIAPDGSEYNIGDNILICAAANLGTMYRQDDEPFTADFWSRIEVVEYNYAPEVVSQDYLEKLMNSAKGKFLTMKDLIHSYFQLIQAPAKPEQKARYMATQFLEFSLLPKADEAIKRDNLRKHLRDYFESEIRLESDALFNPEEAAKVALRRMITLQQYSPKEFFSMYNHFVNQKPIDLPYLSEIQANDIDRYENLRLIFLTLHYLEGALRHLRTVFTSSAGQTEIEGTNREFIKAVYLLGMVM